MALDKECTLVKIETCCTQDSRERSRPSAEFLRVLWNRQAVEINNAEKVVLFRLMSYPLLDSTKVIPKMDTAGRLDTTKYAFHELLIINENVNENPRALTSRAYLTNKFFNLRKMVLLVKRCGTKPS